MNDLQLKLDQTIKNNKYLNGFDVKHENCTSVFTERVDNLSLFKFVVHFDEQGNFWYASELFDNPADEWFYEYNNFNKLLKRLEEL